MTWNEYKFITLNDLSNYESEINFLAGKKDVWTYISPFIFENIGGGDAEIDCYDSDNNVYRVVNYEGSFIVNEDSGIKDGTNIYKIKMYETKYSSKVIAEFNCSEDIDSQLLLNIIDNKYIPTKGITREIASVIRTWQPMIDRAKDFMQYELEDMFVRKGFGVDDIVDKINNKSYFKNCIAYLTLSFIYEDLTLSNASDVIYSNKALAYKNKYKEFFNMIVTLINLDLNEDGVTDLYPNIRFGTLVI